MKTASINYWQIATCLKKITGIDHFTQMEVTDSNGKKVGLLNEKITLDTKVKLERILNEILELFTVIEKERFKMFDQAKGKSKELSKKALEKLNKDFGEVAIKPYEVSFQPIKLDDIKSISSEENYLSIVSIICE